MAIAGRWRRSVQGLVVLALLGALALGPSARVHAATCATSPGASVAVVIDFGSARGAPDGIQSACVPLSSLPGSPNGMEALRAATQHRVTTDASGKVCQISGFPLDADLGNCSAPHDGTISYWSYFHGTAGGWTYSSLGAAAWRVQRDEVEGWHFITVRSGTTHVTPPPRNFADGPSYRWQSVCGEIPAPPPAPSPGAGAGAGGGGGQSGGGPRGGGSGSTGAAQQHFPEPSAPASRQAPAPAPSSKTTTSTGTPSSTTRASAPSSTRRSATGLRSATKAPRLSSHQLAAARSRDASSSPIGAILGVVGGIVVLGLALGLATWRSRRRRQDSG